jgi:geranylgeranyl pyrophosphate synthase
MQLDQALQATEALLLQAVASEEAPVLEEASRHILGAGGKRVRPRLLLLAAQAVGADGLEGAVPLAAAVELVHTATLVHDDINDNSMRRRGRESVNAHWGQTFALLTGDFLFTKAYELMAPYGDLNKITAEATVALVEGETLQAASARDNTLDRETYQRIIAKKTAALFRAAAMTGAAYGGGDDKQVDALGEYGFYLGVLFQIVDDLLDLTGDPRLMGKPVGVDSQQGDGVGLSAATGGNGRPGEPLGVVEPEDPFVAIKRRLIEGGAVEEGRQMAQVLASRANLALDELPPGPAVDELRDMVAFVLERDH